MVERGGDDWADDALLRGDATETWICDDCNAVLIAFAQSIA